MKLFRPYIPIEQRGEVIGYVGSLEPYRVTLQLIHSLRIVARLKPITRFIIIGSGSLQNKIAELVNNDPELKSRTTLLRYVNYRDMPKYLNEIKLFVFPTLSDGLPNTILEALACGCLVLTTRVGGIPDVIKEGVTGFYINDPLNPVNVARRIVMVLDRPEGELKTITVNGRVYVEKRYGYSSALKRWGKIMFCYK